VSPPDARKAIRDRALALGFDAVGFARPELGDEARRNLADYLARGHHGDMGWLADKADRRGDPRRLWPEARTVVVLAANYGPSGDPLEVLGRRERGTISVYAGGDDYHDVLKAKLKEFGRWLASAYSAEIKVFVDTAPVMEKPLAEAAGVGWQGKHTNLVSQAFGSWLFLGEVFTTLDLAENVREDDHCGTCRRCLDACPTAAFPAPYRIDARRCISYLTIEHKGPIDRELRPLMGNRIYGCDDCLAVCPWNKFAQAGRHERLRPRRELTAPRLADLAALDDAGFRALFRGTAVKRTGRDRFVRNVLIAIGNSGDPTLAEAALRNLDDASPLVRAMAVWALARLDPGRAAALAANRCAAEPDPHVAEEWRYALAEVEVRSLEIAHALR
jgi:epoxyqueuosine reductase